jgi:putative transposase
LVDTQGLILNAFVTAANLNDREGLLGILAQSRTKIPSLRKLWADAGYCGREMKEELKYQHKIDLEITKRSHQHFESLPRRWVVERSIAWINKYRRLSKDYEYRTTTSESMIYMTGIRNMLRRIARYV